VEDSRKAQCCKRMGLLQEWCIYVVTALLWNLVPENPSARGNESGNETNI